jgi:hypothetical protein
MELISVDRVVRGRDAHTAMVAHSETSLRRGLEFGEPVVLRVGGRDHYAAKVRQIEFEPEDTIYTLDLGARLPADLAEERLGGLTTDHDLELHEIVDLLGDLRRMPPTEAPPVHDDPELRVALA